MNAIQSASEDESSGSGFIDDHERGWEDVDDEVETTTFTSLFDKSEFTDINTLIEYCRDKHGFDFKKVRKEFGVLSNSQPP